MHAGADVFMQEAFARLRRAAAAASVLVSRDLTPRNRGLPSCEKRKAPGSGGRSDGRGAGAEEALSGVAACTGAAFDAHSSPRVGAGSRGRRRTDAFFLGGVAGWADWRVMCSAGAVAIHRT